MTPLFIAHSIDQQVLELILQNDVDFIVVDTRQVGQTARSGSFFEGGTGYGPDAQTVKRDQVDKFVDQPGFDLILDGPVRVYDVRPLRHAPQTFEERDPPGLPGSWTPWQVAATGVLLLIGLALRGRLLDPRRFRARDVWRPAVTLPAAMVAGALGVAGRVLTGHRLHRGRAGPLRPDPAQRASRAARSRPPRHLGLGHPDRVRGRLHGRPRGLVRVARPVRPPGDPGSSRRRERMKATKSGSESLRRRPGIDRGIWKPFRSLLLAQALAAALGLVFWILVARLVDAHEIGIAATAISAQTLISLLTVLGFGTMLISELPLHEPARQRTLARRSLLVVTVSSARGRRRRGGGPAVAARQPQDRAGQPGRRDHVRGRHRGCVLGDRHRRCLPGAQAVRHPGRAQPVRVRHAVPGHRGVARARVHRRPRDPAVLGAAPRRLGAVRVVAAEDGARRPDQPAAADQTCDG